MITTWGFLISRFVEEENTRQVRNLDTRIIRHHWTNWTRWHKIVEVWNNASSLLKWRFRRPSRHGCLSSKSTKCFVIQMITNEYTIRLLTSQVRPWINVIHETYSKSRSNSPLEKRGRNWAELTFTKTSGNVTGHVPVSYLLIVFPSDFLRSLCKTELFPVSSSFLKWRIFWRQINRFKWSHETFKKIIFQIGSKLKLRTVKMVNPYLEGVNHITYL